MKQQQRSIQCSKQLAVASVLLFGTVTLLGCQPEAPVETEAAVEPTLSPSEDGRAVSSRSSLCAADEDVLLSCKIEGKPTTASLCASQDVADNTGHLYYAYGTPEHLELFYPEGKVPLGKAFKRTHLSFAGATGGVAYSFVNDDWKYIFYSISGTGLEDQGVMVVAADAKSDTQAKASLLCQKGSVIQNSSDALRALTERWNSDDSIAQHGLPPLSESDAMAKCLQHNSEEICQN